MYKEFFLYVTQVIIFLHDNSTLYFGMLAMIHR